MVMMFKMFRSLFETIVNIFKKIFFRGKKDSGSQGEFSMFGLEGPKGFKILLICVVVLLTAGLVFATLQGKDLMRKFDVFLAYEVAPQTTSRDATITEGRGSVSAEIDRVVPLLDAPDCDRLIRILRQGGILNVNDKRDFEVCKRTMTPDKVAIFDVILKGDLPSSVVRNLLDAAEKNPKATGNMVLALSNPDIRAKLSDPQVGADITKSLDVLGALSPEEAAGMMKKIEETPPDYRAATIDAYREISNLKSPEAKEALLRTIDQATNPNEIRDIKNFAAAAQSLRPDEQRDLSGAFEKSNPEIRGELIKTAQTMTVLPEDSPARKALQNLSADIASGKVSPENASKMLRDANAVAAAIRNTKDAEVKHFLEQELERAVGSQNPTALISLAERVNDLVGVSKSVNVEPEEAIKLIRNEDSPKLAAKFRAASEAVKKGMGSDVEKLLKNELSTEDMRAKLDIKTKEEKRFAGLQTENKDMSKNTVDVSASQVSQTASDFKKKESEVRDFEGQLDTMLRAGVPATDPRLAKLFDKLNRARTEKDALFGQFQSLSDDLAKRRRELKERLSPEFRALGIVVPENIIPVTTEEVLSGRPKERLTDLRDVPEFWGDRRMFEKGLIGPNESKFQKPGRRIVRIGHGKGVGKDGLLGIVAPETTLPNLSYTVEASSPGTQQSSQVQRQVQISKSLIIPVLMMRIPMDGINSKAQGIRLLAKFLIPVFDRRTGALAISKGAHAICSSGSIDIETGRIQVSCSEVETEEPEPVSINLSINSADGTPNLLGVVTTERGYALAGAWLTAFSQSALQAFASVGVEPYETKLVKAPTDYLVAGAAGGTQNVMSEIGKAYIDKWLNGPIIWHGYDMMPATAVSGD